MHPPSRNSDRRTFPLFIAFIFFCLAMLPTGTGIAHGPSDIVLTYDASAQTLAVSITHPVGNPATHYIKSINVIKNGTPVETFRYTQQPDNRSFSYRYSVAAISGDVIAVTAICNRFGSKTETLTIR